MIAEGSHHEMKERNPPTHRDHGLDVLSPLERNDFRKWRQDAANWMAVRNDKLRKNFWKDMPEVLSAILSEHIQAKYIRDHVAEEKSNHQSLFDRVNQPYRRGTTIPHEKDAY